MQSSLCYCSCIEQRVVLCKMNLVSAQYVLGIGELCKVVLDAMLVKKRAKQVTAAK